MLFFIFSFHPTVYSQKQLSLEGRRGVTVITHGFSPGGKISEEWINFAKAVRTRAGKGSIFINDAHTGLWKALDEQNTNQASDEIIFIYDWAWASDNLSSGYLEACADHLFAALLNPPKALQLNKPTALLEKPLHLIGHSRGAVLLSTLTHKIGWFFEGSPEISVAHFTLLDAHPAAPMGDCALPGILGLCPPPKVYKSQDIAMQLPHCVIRADNYYRQDGVYEDIITDKIVGPYDGIRVEGLGRFNCELNNQTLTYGSSTMGGAHASIATRWYYGTIDFDNLYKHPIINSWYVEDEKYPAMGPRETTGYFFSRLGGGQLPEPIPEPQKIAASPPKKILFNGDFSIERVLWKGKIPGWEENGAAGDAKLSPQQYEGEFAIRLERPKFNFLNKDIHMRQHSLGYFPLNLKGKPSRIELVYKVLNQPKGKNTLKISYILADSQTEVILQEINISETKTAFQTVSIKANPQILGKVGAIRMSLEGDNNNKIVDIKKIDIVQ